MEGNTMERAIYHAMRLTISRESIVLILLCALDAIVTVILVTTGKATEANPLMARFLDKGIWQFYIAKIGSVVPMVVVAEWHRRTNPVFVKRAIRLGIAAYVGLYFGLLIVVNAA